MPIMYMDQEYDDSQALELLTSRDGQISDLTAERESLTERNQALSQKVTQLQDELQQTKKLNYTLAAQIPQKDSSYQPGQGFLDYLK